MHSKLCVSHSVMHGFQKCSYLKAFALGCISHSDEDYIFSLSFLFSVGKCCQHYLSEAAKGRSVKWFGWWWFVHLIMLIWPSQKGPIHQALVPPLSQPIYTGDEVLVGWILFNMGEGKECNFPAPHSLHGPSFGVFCKFKAFCDASYTFPNRRNVSSIWKWLEVTLG